jgi:hypothetical protein
VPDTEEGKRDIKWIEKAHIALWLLKDMSWVSHWHWVGMAAILPTLGLAIKIAYDSRRVLADFVHDVAVCLWICANITWMLGEFFVNDETRPIAKVFFWLGAVVLLGYYAYAGSKRLLHVHRLRHQVSQEAGRSGQ